MKRRKKTIQTKQQLFTGIQNKLDNGQYTEVVALDPGGRLSFGGIRKYLQTQEETSIRYLSSSYRFDSKQYQHNEIYRRLTNAHFAKQMAERQTLPNNASCTGDPDIFIDFQLKHFDNNKKVLMTKTMAKLDFERFEAMNAASKLGQLLALDTPYMAAINRHKRDKRRSKQRHKETEIIDCTPQPIRPENLIFIGSTDVSPFIKSYVKSPNRRIKLGNSGDRARAPKYDIVLEVLSTLHNIKVATSVAGIET